MLEKIVSSPWVSLTTKEKKTKNKTNLFQCNLFTIFIVLMIYQFFFVFGFMFAFAARFLFSYFIFVKKNYPQKLERPAHYVEVYRSKQDLDKERVDVTGARGLMATENTSSFVLTQSSIDHQNLFIVFFMPSKQLQITFIVSSLVQLRLVKSRLLATTDPTELSTLFFFNNNTLNAHHSYIATGMRVIVEYNNVQDKWGLSNIHSTHTTQQRESSTLVRVKLNIHETTGYTQELYIWSVKVTWIYTVVH